MARTVLDDGRWFDKTKAEKWDEEKHWNGNNHISCATGSQYNHERLYRTAGGKYIVAYWSQWQGSTSGYREISKEDAAQWLVKNGHDEPEELEDETSALEVA